MKKSVLEINGTYFFKRLVLNDKVKMEQMFSGMIIGREITILSANDPTLNGISGTVIDETKNMIHILNNGKKIVRVPKSIITLEISDSQQGERVRLEGSSIVGTPADRIKS